jgi:hypothetical protein
MNRTTDAGPPHAAGTHIEHDHYSHGLSLNVEAANSR